MTEKRFLTISEVAELLRSTPGSIRAQCCRRKIPFVKVGRKVLFDVREIEQWIRRVPAVEATR